MEAKEVLLRSLAQSRGYLTGALHGLTQKEATWAPAPESNSIIFILWHVTRVEDFFFNRVVQRLPELYEAEGWGEKLGTPEKGTGWEYTLEQLRAWPVPQLADVEGYFHSVRKKTLDFINSLTAEKLSEIPRPERSSDSVGVTLTRIVTEIALHVGQIAYLRGAQRGLNK
ncbi:MAG: DinB family protein [Dehalococcoidales bacterium]|nr:DinB family protein [Dehalococcoidales bacterium]